MNPELGVDGSDFLGFPEVRLAQIMHHVARFFPSGELVRVCEPTGWIGVSELVVPRVVPRVWVYLPWSAGLSGALPRGSRAGRREGERDVAEYRPLRTTRWQMDADARDVSITRAPILIRRSRIVANSAAASGLVCGIAALRPCISQNAAVWRASRT
jgi:hypothetical protein